jgi:hypothetical protein
MTAEDDQGGEVAYRYDLSPEETISEGVVRAVSEWLDAVPTSGETNEDQKQVLDPLYSVINPDALDAIFRTRETEHSGKSDLERVEVAFRYHGGLITVREDGTITIQGSKSQTDPPVP